MFNQRDIENYFSEFIMSRRSRRERRYSSAQLEIARGMRGAIWLSDAALDGFSEARLNYIESAQQRAARDGKAHHADKSVRFFFK